ncbi:MAG: hypothetical protein KF828_09290 [Anaerolineales bacterium]|nr:hypothetical protein [Anaerolineales bacterium]
MLHRFKLLLIVAVLATLALACSTSSQGDSEQAQDLAATQQALAATQQALAQQQSALTAAPQVPQEEPEQDVSEVYDDEPYYVEEFSVAPPTWSYFLLEGDERDFQFYTQNDRLIFDINGEYVWAYYTYDSWYYRNVRVDFRAENLGNNNNNVSLICRYNERGWYEFNISNNGLYWILRYENSSGSFHELYSGGIAHLRTGKNTNDYTAICDGDRLTLAVNGVEVRTVTDSRYDEGYIGVGVASFEQYPVLVELDYVEISEP